MGGRGGELDQGAIGSRFTAADCMVSLTYQVFQEEFQGGWLGLNCRAGQNNLHGDGRDAMVSKARVAAMQEKHGSEGLMQSFSTVSDVACIRAATDTGCRADSPDYWQIAASLPKSTSHNLCSLPTSKQAHSIGGLESPFKISVTLADITRRTIQYDVFVGVFHRVTR